jgi:hypothetical protein
VLLSGLLHETADLFRVFRHVGPGLRQLQLRHPVFHVACELCPCATHCRACSMYSAGLFIKGEPLDIKGVPSHTSELWGKPTVFF